MSGSEEKRKTSALATRLGSRNITLALIRTNEGSLGDVFASGLLSSDEVQPHERINCNAAELAGFVSGHLSIGATLARVPATPVCRAPFERRCATP